MVMKADLLVCIGVILFLISMGHVQNTIAFWLTLAIIGGATMFVGIMLSGG